MSSAVGQPIALGKMSSDSKPFSISFSNTKSKSSTSFPRTQTERSNINDTRKSSSSRFSRPPHNLQDNDSDGEDDQPPAAEEVTAFDRDAGGAISAHKRETTGKQPLIINVESKNNWQDRARQRRKNLLPPEVQAQRAQGEKGATDKKGTAVEVEGPSMKYGLTYAQKSENVSSGLVEPETNHTLEQDTPLNEAQAKPPNQDDAALQALLNESKGENGTKRSDLVIESQDKRDLDEEVDPGFDETRDFRADVASRPEPASLSDYNAIPVEEFGAALLRGMGWKEGEPVGRGNYSASTATARVPERRPGYLGIGAKDVGKSGAAEAELGAWGKGDMKKSKKPGDGLYTPVLMKNKVTGEMITEDDFNKVNKGDKNKDEWEERRDRNLQKNGRGSRRDYDDYGSDGYQRSTTFSRRNGSSSPESRDRDRRRHRRDIQEDNYSESRRDDRYYRDRERRHKRDYSRDRDSDKTRKYKESSKSRDDDYHRSRHASRHDPDYRKERDRRDRYGGGKGSRRHY